MTGIRKAFCNLKIDLKAVASRKTWIPLDQDNYIAFGREPTDVTWIIFAFTSCTANDVGAPELLHSTICKAAEQSCPGLEPVSKWARTVTTTTGFLGNLQAVGTDARERGEMMNKVPNIIRGAKMKPGPWIVFNPRTKEMPLVPLTPSEIAAFPKVLGHRYSEEHSPSLGQPVPKTKRYTHWTTTRAPG